MATFSHAPAGIQTQAEVRNSLFLNSWDYSAQLLLNRHSLFDLLLTNVSEYYSRKITGTGTVFFYFVRTNCYLLPDCSHKTTIDRLSIFNIAQKKIMSNHNQGQSPKYMFNFGNKH